MLAPANHGLLFERSKGVSIQQALPEVGSEKRGDSTEPLILQNVHEFMCDQAGVPPKVGPDQNAMAQREPDGVPEAVIDPDSHDAQKRMFESADGIHLKKAHRLGIFQA